jgi:pilus assembly protein Flp/PilA
MRDNFLKLYVRIQGLKNAMIRDERGQDLIEYALVVSLIALAATAGMGTVASSISTAFSKVGSKMASYTS